MLIDEYCEIILNPKNYKHYEKLGYILPKRKNKSGGMSVCYGNKIKVKIKDLTKGSWTKVKVRCDSCGEESEKTYMEYYNHNHDGLTYCKSCASTILNKGENNPNYNFNKTEDERKMQRNYPEYIEFIKKVLLRDNYTCKICSKKSEGDMVVHHLDGFDNFIEKRTDESNGICLCKNCHENFHSIYGKGDNTREQFEEWSKKAIGELSKYNGELPMARKIYCIEDDKIYDSIFELSYEISDGKYTCITRIYDVCNHKKRHGHGYCKSYKGKHFLWLNEYENMSYEDLQEYLDWCKPNHSKKKLYKKVICLTTNKIFDSIKQAGEYYNIPKNGISRACKEKSQYCGKLQDGTRLKWRYYEQN